MVQVVAVLLIGAIAGFAPVAGLVPLATALVALAAPDPWIPLAEEEIGDALTSRTLGYPDGTVQDFMADGRTLYGSQWGRWSVRDNRYCSVWPPSDLWACYDVAQRGLDIRFTSEAGEVTVGRYVDLN